MLVIYKAYNYYVKPIDLKNIPYIKNNKICDKIKFNENDGIIFSNQDKKVYSLAFIIAHYFPLLILPPDEKYFSQGISSCRRGW